MAKKSLLILYFSKSGNTERMATAIAEGAGTDDVDVTIRNVEDCQYADLAAADGIVLGSPTYFSNLAWQVKRLIDESIVLYGDRKLKGKPGGLFTSAGTERDAKQCLAMLEAAMVFHHQMDLEPGILRLDGQSDGETQATCRAYGQRLARKLTGSG